MHDGVTLGGPVWLLLQFLILGTVALAAFVFVDSLRPARRARVAGRLREPLWLYAALSGAFLALLAAVQILPGLNRAAAVVSIATPFAFALGIAYLLRAVYPKVEDCDGASAADEDRSI